MDALLYAPPNAGDATFVAAFNNLVNARRYSAGWCPLCLNVDLKHEHDVAYRFIEMSLQVLCQSGLGGLGGLFHRRPATMLSVRYQTHGFTAPHLTELLLLQQPLLKWAILLPLAVPASRCSAESFSHMT